MPERLRGLVVDWGGVLTTGLDRAMEAWAEQDGIDYPHFQRVMRELLGVGAAAEALYNPVHALERGEVEVPHFEEELAARLRPRGEQPVIAERLLKRMFTRFERADDMVGLVRRTHQSGIRTALLSNSWGNDYPRDGWDEMFDEVVISGEVGMRKPEPRIFHHTVDRLGLSPQQCVFVDDLAPNVRAATALGMVGIHHVGYPTTSAQIEALLGPGLL